MKKEMIFPLAAGLAFAACIVTIMFLGLRKVPFFKFVGDVLAAIFNLAISAFAHG